MPRPQRLDLPGIAQHVIQRGNDRRPCFFAEIDYVRYLQDLREIARREACAVHACAVMINHIHLLMHPAAPGCIAPAMQAPGRHRLGNSIYPLERLCLNGLCVNKNIQPSVQFVPNVWAALAHLLLLAGMLVLFMGRKPGAFRAQRILDVLPGFYSHVSNLSLSYLLLAGVGFIWLIMGVSMRYVALAALGLLVANITYELLLPVLNIRDPIDAVYGAVGTLLGFVWLWLLARVGLKAVPSAGLPRRE